MSGANLQTFYSLFNQQTTINLRKFPGVEFATLVSTELVVPEGAQQIHLRDGLWAYLFDRNRCLVVVTALNGGDGYKYDLYNSIDPHGLYTQQVFEIAQTYTSAQ